MRRRGWGVGVDVTKRHSLAQLVGSSDGVCFVGGLGKLVIERADALF